MDVEEELCELEEEYPERDEELGELEDDEVLDWELLLGMEGFLSVV